MEQILIFILIVCIVCLLAIVCSSYFPLNNLLGMIGMGNSGKVISGAGTYDKELTSGNENQIIVTMTGQKLFNYYDQVQNRLQTVKCSDAESVDITDIMDAAATDKYTARCFTGEAKNNSPDYLFKWNIKNAVTDAFIASIGMERFGWFNVKLNSYLNNVAQNILKVLKPDPERILYVMYKGGNNINMYIRILAQIIQKSAIESQNQGFITDAQRIVDHIKTNQKNSDFDYSIIYHASQDDHDERMKIKYIFDQILSCVKDKIRDLLKVDTASFLDRLHNDLIVGGKFDAIKNMFGKDATIKSISSNNTKISLLPGNQYSVSRIEPLVNNSFVIFNRASDSKFNDYIEFADYSGLNVCGEKQKQTDVYLSITAPISTTNLLPSKFDLARVKINVDIEVDTGVSRMVNYPVELVDLSFIYPNKNRHLHDQEMYKRIISYRLRHVANQPVLHEYLLFANRTPFDKLKSYNDPNVQFDEKMIINFETAKVYISGNDYVVYPSIYYLILDLKVMLFDANVVAWVDVKYTKRITRFVYVGLFLSLMSDKPAEIAETLALAKNNTIDTFINLFNMDRQTLAQLPHPDSLRNMRTVNTIRNLIPTSTYFMQIVLEVLIRYVEIYYYKILENQHVHPDTFIQQLPHLDNYMQAHQNPTLVSQFNSVNADTIAQKIPEFLTSIKTALEVFAYDNVINYFATTNTYYNTLNANKMNNMIVQTCTEDIKNGNM